ncbi:glutamine amidotransferase [Rhodococcus sp. CUA-806]|jgi:GMP synthase-like glutamine amidotransferase|nr:glutamine amidotransferase [Rhodococcus sp. CUA-806]OLT31962.1 glutamine amidotransferase [Rhodococcus sp. CUA-806]OLT34982.1 glutamine amidotransferase [Rhodococcus sp. CUA-806]
MLEILVLQHVGCEPPAAYTPELARVARVRTVNIGVDPLPDSTNFAAIVSMGGPMGYGDRSDIEWIQQEVCFLKEAIARRVPVWGVCLGAQLLAAALGAPVYTGSAPEVGLSSVELTAAGESDPVWSPLGTEIAVMQWHSDTFDLPVGAELLASSGLYPNQLFRYDRSYGVQFHIEADRDLAAKWLEFPEYRESLEQALGAGAGERFLDALEATEGQMLLKARKAMSLWIDEVVLNKPGFANSPVFGNT